MKKIQFSIIFFLLIGFSFSGCLDEIELDQTVDLEDNIAIQGKLVKGTPSKVDVFVSRLSNLIGVNLPKAILDAEVFISDEAGTEYQLNNVNSGFYELEIPVNDPLVIDVNRTYKLTVKLVDGNVYESNMEMLLPVPKITSVDTKIIQREIINSAGIPSFQENIEFSLNTPIVTPGSTTKSQMIWELFGTFQITDSPAISCRPMSSFPDPKKCYVTQKINLEKAVTFDGTKFSTDEITDFPLSEGGINFLFAEGYYMTFLQQSLTSDAYNYWTTTNELLERSGSLFDAPAGKIESNFTNLNNPEEDVFGYFYATEQDTARIYIDPNFVSNPDTRCPEPYDPLSPPAECCNCLELNNSTVDKPDWWQ